MDLTNDFWTGLLLGVTFGVLVGIAWEDAYEKLKEAYRERKKMKDESGHAGDGFIKRQYRYIRERTSHWTVFGVVLAMVAIMQVSLGVFQLVAYSRQTNFIECQAQYNQDSSEARSARLGPAATENDALYAWLETLPPLLRTDGQEQDPKAIENFSQKLTDALQTHRQNVKTQKEHPYPPEPEETCGN